MNQAVGGITNEVSMMRKLGYTLYSVGGEFVYSTIGIFLLIFFTDVALIGAAVGGGILLVSRGLSAFADFFMGFVADRSRNKRIFTLIGAVPVGLSFVMLFQVPDLTMSQKYIYYFIVAWLTWTLYSFVHMPLISMLPNMTLDSHERTKIMALSRFFNLVTLIAIGGAFLPMVGFFSDSSGQVQGYSRVSMIIGVIIVAAYLISAFSAKEMHEVSLEQRYKFKDGFKLIMQNRPYIVLLAAVFIEFIIFTIVGIMISYFFKYCLIDEKLIPVGFSCLFIIAAISMPLWVFLSKKIGKKAVYQAGFISYGLMLAVLFFIDSVNYPIIISLFIWGGISFGGLSLSFLSNTPDTVDYGQWKTGARCEGFQFGLYNFMIKLSGSLAGLITGLVLELTGYQPNIAQNPETLMAIRVLMTLVPAGLCFIGAAVMQWYGLNAETHMMICNELKKKHSIS